MSNHSSCNDFGRRARTAAGAVLTALALAAPTAAQAPDSDATRYETDWFGHSWARSGEPTLKLHVNETGGDTAIRLTGGTPGAHAMILVGTAGEPLALPGGGMLWVRAAGQPLVGRFDPQGTYAWPAALRRYAVGMTVCFQAMDSGIGAPGMPVQMSQGLQVDVFPAPPPAALNLDVSEIRGLAIVKVAGRVVDLDMPGAVDEMLNSDGDAIEIEVKGGVTGGLFGANIGGEVGFKAEVKRGSHDGVDHYELMVAADVALSGGVKPATGLEVRAAAGRGVKKVFRFASREELGKGILYLYLTQVFRRATNAAALIDQLPRTMNPDRLRRAFDTAAYLIRKLDLTPRWLRGRLWRAVKAVQYRILGHIRDAMLEAQRAVMAVRMVIHEVAEAKTFLMDHSFALETSLAGAADAKGEIDAEKFKLGASVHAEMKQSLRIELPKPGKRAVFVLTRKLQRKLGASGFATEFEQEIELEIVGRFQRDDSGMLRRTDARISISVDVFRKAVKVIGFGVGRKMSIEMDRMDMNENSLQALTALLDGDLDGAVAALQQNRITLMVQDRYAGGFEFDKDITVLGCGGKIEAKAIWTDQMEQVKSDLPLRECLHQLLVAGPPILALGPAFRLVTDAGDQAQAMIFAAVR